MSLQAYLQDLKLAATHFINGCCEDEELDILLEEWASEDHSDMSSDERQDHFNAWVKSLLA